MSPSSLNSDKVILLCDKSRLLNLYRDEKALVLIVLILLQLKFSSIKEPNPLKVFLKNT